MGLSVFAFDGTSSSEYGIIIDKSGAYAAAERDFSTFEVPGRNGELTFDNGRWKNVVLTYSCMIKRSFPVNMPGFHAWLMSKLGYKRLEDSLQPDYYRMARVASVPDPETFAHYIGGKFDVEFDCMPQKWLKAGEKEVPPENWASNTRLVLTNPTYYEAAPLVRITGGNGSGSILKINGDSVKILQRSNSEVLVIDFETGDAYSETTHANMNQYIELSGTADFPKLRPGDNTIETTNTLNRNNVRIAPRWWTI